MKRPPYPRTDTAQRRANPIREGELKRPTIGGGQGRWGPVMALPNRATPIVGPYSHYVRYADPAGSPFTAASSGSS